MRTIKPVTPVIYQFECPRCGYYIENSDTGSTDWTQEDLAHHIEEFGRKITCNFCDETFRLSSSVKLGRNAK